MKVEQIAVGNRLRNYMYLVACPETREAAAIDPLDANTALERAKSLGWTIRSVINTHEHPDHIDGNGAVIAATGAVLYAHYQAMDKIPNVDVGLKAGEVIDIGTSVRLTTLDTPGHTFCHSCFYYEGKGDQEKPTNESVCPALFSGDTLFNAGVGNCHNGGDPQTLYHTFRDQLFKLPEETRIFPGHDYIVNNLQFTLDREPNNAAAKSLLAALEQWPGDQHFISNIAMERLVNAFFRLDSAEIIRGLRMHLPDAQSVEAESVFLALRELRNRW